MDLGRWDFFQNPSKQPQSVVVKTEENIWLSLSGLHEDVQVLFKKILRAGEDAKHMLLSWIGDCLKANAGRGKLWTSEVGALMGNSFVSDGFMLNLGAVMLKLCGPFTQGKHNVKLLKVNVAYRFVTEYCTK